MRIEFPNSPREDFHWDGPALRVGSAPDNDLILAAHQAGAYHLRIQMDRRGWVLQVLPQGNRIYVNARPVREKALLRAGDILSVGDCRMLLRTDEQPAHQLPLTVPAEGRCTVALRAVAGPLSGRVLSLQEKLELGPHGRIPLELAQGETASLAVFWKEGQLMLEAASQGLGIAIMHDDHFRRASDKKLARLYDVDVESPYSYWFVCRPKSLEQRPVKLFHDWMIEVGL